jgi:hypothetical protein
MATCERTSDGSGVMGILLAGIAGVALLAAGLAAVMPNVEDVIELPDERIDDHADVKHGSDAQAARDWIASNGGPGCKWECPDGRTRYVCRTDTGRWAIVVINTVTRVEVTAFMTDSQDYIQGCIAGGDNPWHYGSHP